MRSMMNRALGALDDGTWETRGLRFVWHSLRHGSASRAYLRGGAVVLPDLLVRSSRGVCARCQTSRRSQRSRPRQSHWCPRCPMRMSSLVSSCQNQLFHLIGPSRALGWGHRGPRTRSRGAGSCPEGQGVAHVAWGAMSSPECPCLQHHSPTSFWQCAGVRHWGKAGCWRRQNAPDGGPARFHFAGLVGEGQR